MRSILRLNSTCWRLSCEVYDDGGGAGHLQRYEATSFEASLPLPPSSYQKSRRKDGRLLFDLQNPFHPALPRCSQRSPPAYMPIRQKAASQLSELLSYRYIAHGIGRFSTISFTSQRSGKFIIVSFHFNGEASNTFRPD